jgi:hypothetical protein
VTSCVDDVGSVMLMVNTALLLSSIVCLGIIVIACVLLRRGTVVPACCAWVLAGLAFAQVHALVLLGPRFGVDMAIAYIGGVIAVSVVVLAGIGLWLWRRWRSLLKACLMVALGLGWVVGSIAGGLAIIALTDSANLQNAQRARREPLNAAQAGGLPEDCPEWRCGLFTFPYGYEKRVGKRYIVWATCSTYRSVSVESGESWTVTD